jgi:hypothetical protein
MIVRIKGKDDLEELAIVEFQGEILGDMEGELGELQIKGTKVDMTLGQHTLVGKVVDLKNPFLVVEKKPISEGMAVVEPTSEGEEGSTRESRMACHGIVQKKILFNTRPTPIRMKSRK